MIDRAEIDIRPGREADLAAIAEVLVGTWRTAFRGMLPDGFLDGMSVAGQVERQRRRMKAESVSYVVATERGSGRIVGFANSGPTRMPRMPYSAELYALYVLDAWQQRGVGRMLVRAAAAQAVRQERRSMLVWVLADNPNRKFYSKLGAVPVGRSPIEIGGVVVGQIGYAWDDLMAQFGLETA